MNDKKRNEQAIAELLHDIQSNDIIKAQLVLQDVDTYPSSVQKRLLFEVSRAEDAFAIPVLVFLWQERPMVISAYPELKDILLSKAAYNPSLVLSRLQPGERCLATYARLCGEVPLPSAVDGLLAVLHKVSSSATLKTIVEALGSIGDPRAVKPLGEFLYLKGSEVALQAVIALGRIASPQALEQLSQRIGQESAIDAALIPEFSALDPLYAVPMLNRIFVRGTVAVQEQAGEALKGFGCKAVTELHTNLVEGKADLQRRTLRVLQGIPDQRSVQAIRKLLMTQPGEEVRGAAYETLGELGLTQGGYLLVGGLSDRSQFVRLAAARAVEHNAGPMMLSGLKNILEAGDAQALGIVRTLLQARATTVVASLWTDEHVRPLVRQAAEGSEDASMQAFLASLS